MLLKFIILPQNSELYVTKYIWDFLDNSQKLIWHIDLILKFVAQ